MMTSAVGYTRLSQRSDRSIDAQKTSIREYCTEESIKLDTIYDDGEMSSGFNPEREKYVAMKNHIEEESVDAVVVDHKSRIGREFDERMRFILDLRERDVELHTAFRGHIDLSDPTDVAVESVHAARDDEAAREQIEKAKEATRERIEAGYDHGRPPFGLQFGPEKQHWVPDEDFETAVDVLDAKEDGTSYAEIKQDTGVPKATAYRIVERAERYRELEQQDEPAQ